MSRARPPAPADFPHRTTVTIRYADLDRQGHVNNAVFMSFLEAGRVHLIRDHLDRVMEPGHTFVLARMALDYLGEMHWPGDATIGTGIARIGSTSIAMRQAVFDGERCTASAEAVVVMIDRDTRLPVPLSPAVREALGPLVIPG